MSIDVIVAMVRIPSFNILMNRVSVIECVVQVCCLRETESLLKVVSIGIVHKN